MKVTADDIAQLVASAPPRRVPGHVAQAVRRAGSSWVSVLFGLGFGAFGLIFVVLFFPWRVGDELRLTAGATQTAGTITGVSDAHMSVNDERVMEYQFAFTTATGLNQTASAYASGMGWSPGDTVAVRYLPGDPAVACLVEGRLNKAGLGGMLVLIFPGAGFALAAWFYVLRMRPRRVLECGQAGEVDVLAVKETGMKVNEQPVYAITLSGPALGAQPVTVKRLNLAEVELAARSRENKQPIFVLFDPRKPAHLIFPEALIER